MAFTAGSIGCPRCKAALPTQLLSKGIAACTRCDARILITAPFESALARSADLQIVQIEWKEVVRSDILAIALFPLSLLRIVNLVALAVALLILGLFVAGYAMRLFSGEFQVDKDLPSLRLILIVLTPILLFFVIPRIELMLRKLFPNHFVYSPCYIVSGTELVIMMPSGESVVLPWRTIVGASFSTATALTEVRYSTANGQIATLSLAGNEYASILDVIRAKFPEIVVTEPVDFTA